MKSRAIIPLVVGLGIGVFAVKMFVDVLKRAKGSQGDTVQVIRTAAEVTAATAVTKEMIEVVDVPKALAPGQSFQDPQKVIGRVTSARIPKGIMVVETLLAPPGTQPGMAARIPDGYRAVAVQVDEYVGVAGWLKPGSHVDLVVVLNVKHGGKSQTISQVILQDVEVLAVGQEIDGGDPQAALSRSVTLQVRPGDVPKLHLAATRGKLRLAMRNRDDATDPEYATTTDNDLLPGLPESTEKSDSGGQGSLLSRLFGNQSEKSGDETDKDEVAKLASAVPVRVAPPAKPAWVVEVMSGDRAYEVEFDSKGPDARKLNDDSKQGRHAPFGTGPAAPLGPMGFKVGDQPDGPGAGGLAEPVEVVGEPGDAGEPPVPSE